MTTALVASVQDIDPLDPGSERTPTRAMLDVDLIKAREAYCVPGPRPRVPRARQGADGGLALHAAARAARPDLPRTDFGSLDQSPYPIDEQHRNAPAKTARTPCGRNLSATRLQPTPSATS